MHLPTYETLKKHFYAHLKEYIKTHPGKYLRLELDLDGVRELFFDNEEELKAGRDPSLVGGTSFSEYIPVKTHRFNKDNKTLEIRVDEHVTLCPNDNETELIGMNPIMSKRRDNGSTEYSQQAYCPDCNYHVFRRPSDETIKEVEENMKKTIVG